jgi:cellulose synthase/poly-beta-1,6-N-acetylglucosamine synthase-like glycosyltransferase
MLIVYVLSFIVGIAYFIVILSFSIGWDKIKTFQKGTTCPSDVFISVIISLRNEANNIHQLINSLLNQSLSSELFELILVNDNSTDETYRLINENIAGIANFRCLSLKGKQGKKYSIEYGIKNSKGNLIVTTDADCIHHKEWLETIYQFYSINKPKIIIGPVLMQGNTFFENFQKIDFLSLIASGAGSSGIGKPIMCNGANLAFDKDVFMQLTDPMTNKEISGDDVFLMHNIKKIYPKQVKFLKSNNAVVFTKAEKDLKSFVNQRKRWASKSKSYFDKDTIFTALIVFLTNSLLLLYLPLSIINTKFLSLFIFQVIAKLIVDFILILKASVFFKERELLNYFIPAELLNIVMIPILALLGFSYKGSWKKQTISEQINQ